MITKGSPWASRRVGHAALDDVLRQFLLTLWNVYGFFVTYANADGFDPSSSDPPPVAERPEMDRWAISQLHRTIRAARDGLNAYDATAAGRRIETFVDDLSNWYVRRSRRRFWNHGGQEGHDAAAAFHTLHECLVATSALLAPFTPFVAEALWRNLGAGRAERPVSVHLADYPDADDSLIDEELDAAMAAARQIVELGRRVRVETRSRTRRPLAEAVVHVPGSHRLVGPLLATVADELNVKRVVFAESDESFGRWRAKPNFKALGPRLGEAVKDVAAALAADAGDAAQSLAHGESVTVAGVSIGPDDVDLVQEVSTGWGVASEGGLTVALDLEITDELRREGLARDLVRAVQDARKAAGLNVSDRIVLVVEAEGELAQALTHHRDLVAGETLAVELIVGRGAEAAFRQDAEVEGSVVTIWLARA
jgi:isoleucyl-tRNA synthetase